MEGRVRKVPNLSPSSVSTYRACPTKWAYPKLFGIRPEEQPHLKLGSAVHALAEHFIQHGRWPEISTMTNSDAYHIARAGQALLQPLHERYLAGQGEVEKAYQIPAKSGLGPLPIYCVTDFVDSERREVVDHKTTKNMWAPWLPDSRALAQNPQMLWYGYLEFRENPGPFSVQHNYFSTSDRGSRRNGPVRVHWDDALENADTFVTVAKEMFDLFATVDKIDDVPYNLDACGDYGGCPFRDCCPHFARNAGAPPPPFGGTKVDFKALVAARNQKGSAPPTQPSPEPTPTLGQVSPPDTPGATEPSEAMVDELAETMMKALGEEYYTASRSEYSAAALDWLESDEGRSARNRLGFGTSTLEPELLDVFGIFQPDETPADPVPADPVPIPEETPGVPPEMQPIVDALSVYDDYKAEIEDVKGLLCALVGAKRFGKNIRAEALGKLAQARVADSNNEHVWLVVDPDPDKDADKDADADETPAPAPAPTPTPAPTPASPSKSASWTSTCFQVGSAPSMPCPFIHIDQVLQQYYDEIAAELGVETYNSDNYHKGPRLVAARVAVEVRDAELRPMNGFVVVPAGHPMAPFIEQMFPSAYVWRA